MKTKTPYWFALVAALLLTRTALGAGTQFSADMVIKSQEDGVQTMRLYVGNQKMRVEMKGADAPQMITIIDTQANTLISLMPEARTYMEMAGGEDSLDWLPVFDPNDVEADDDHAVKKVGTEKINGYVCDKYVATPKKAGLEKSTTWVATKLGYPIKSVSPTSSMELINIKEGTQPASLFTVPQGYQKMPGMEELYRGMMQR